MKKLLKIELIDGKTIERDITNEPGVRKLPIGTPANHAAFAEDCQRIACFGFEAQDADIGPKKYKYIGPSQIKSVTIQFVD